MLHNRHFLTTFSIVTAVITILLTWRNGVVVVAAARMSKLDIPATNVSVLDDGKGIPTTMTGHVAAQQRWGEISTIPNEEDKNWDRTIMLHPQYQSVSNLLKRRRLAQPVMPVPQLEANDNNNNNKNQYHHTYHDNHDTQKFLRSNRLTQDTTVTTPNDPRRLNQNHNTKGHIWLILLATVVLCCTLAILDYWRTKHKFVDKNDKKKQPLMAKNNNKSSRDDNAYEDDGSTKLHKRSSSSTEVSPSSPTSRRILSFFSRKKKKKARTRISKSSHVEEEEDHEMTTKPQTEALPLSKDYGPLSGLKNFSFFKTTSTDADEDSRSSSYTMLSPSQCCGGVLSDAGVLCLLVPIIVLLTLVLLKFAF